MRGFTTCGGDNCLQDSIDVANDVIVPKSKDEIAICFEVGCALGVLYRPLDMSATIKLDYQSRGLTAEIDDVIANWYLATKLQTAETAVAHTKP